MRSSSAVFSTKMATERRPMLRPTRPTADVDSSLEPHEEYIGKLIRSMEALKEKGLLIDAVVECEDGVELPCHKLVLAASCRYFRRMVVADTSEAQKKELLRINLPTKINGKCMQRILKFIYSGSVDMPNDGQQVKELLAASHYLQLDDFNRQLAAVLVRSLSVDNYTFVWDLAEEYDVTELQSEVVKFVSQDLHRFMKFPEFLSFSPWRLRLLLSSRCVTTTSPNKVLLGVIEWVKLDISNREREMAQLLRYIKFSKLSNPFLKGLITTEPLVSQCHTLWCFIAATLYSRGVHLNNYDPERDNITNQHEKSPDSFNEQATNSPAGDAIAEQAEKTVATATCKIKLKRITKPTNPPTKKQMSLNLKTIKSLST